MFLLHGLIFIYWLLDSRMYILLFVLYKTDVVRHRKRVAIEQLEYFVLIVLS